MIRKLRDRGEPITLFGETHYESYLRLKRLESLVPDFKNMVRFERVFKPSDFEIYLPMDLLKHLQKIYEQKQIFIYMCEKKQNLCFQFV